MLRRSIRRAAAVLFPYRPTCIRESPLQSLSKFGRLKRQFCDTNLHLKHREYDHLPDDLIFDARVALRELNSLNTTMLEDLIEIYMRNFIPQSTVVKAYAEITELIKKNHFKGKKIDAELDSMVKQQARKLHKNVSLVIELLDKGHCGFLTGDITPKLVIWMRKFLDDLAEQFEDKIAKLSLTQNIRNTLLNDLYHKLFKVCSEEVFKLPSLGIPFPDSENPRNLFERQLILENESSDIAIDKFMSMYDDLSDMGMAHTLSFAKRYVIQWFPELCRAIKTEQERCLEPGLTGDRLEYAPYLLRLSPEKLALITLSEVMRHIMQLASKREESDDRKNGYYIISKGLFASIGKSVNQQLVFENEESNILSRIRQEFKEKEGTISKAALTRKTEMLRKSATERILKGKISSKFDKLPLSMQLQLGSSLVFMMMNTTNIKNSSNISVRLLTLDYVRASSDKKNKKVIGVCKVQEEFVHGIINEIERKDSKFIQLERSLPMIYQPAPWIDYEVGGYYQKQTQVMRVQSSNYQENAVRFADMTKIYGVLDIVGKVPWRINLKVLKVVEDLWALGGDVGEIPSRYYDYQDYVYEYMVQECADPVEKRRLIKRVQLQRDVHSLRGGFNLKLEQAQAFSKIGKFYYPHNIDFRGRMYPIPPHLNHISSDICRGLLQFGVGKPLGKSGLKWLKIHLANKMGKDKLKMEDREAYTDSIIGLIENVVKDPIANREWLQQEDCWQTLAAMYEVHAAVNTPNPEQYVTYAHVHQDGTCNGLQHYAAMGRDYEGAYQVNLVDRKQPGDLYTHIAKMVEQQVSKDAEDPTSPEHDLALKLRGNIKRKIIKQTVMTTVYGVTFIGARAQIHKQLRDKDFLDQNDDKESYLASMYIAKMTLDCVANLFTQAHEIKQWLKDCAKCVSEAGMSMSWMTPLGNSSSAEQVHTILQSVTVSDRSDDLPVSKVKQQTAFPPNFVHSLDSAHMMYTALRCHQEGITFAAVHDSYWTHPSDLERMSVLLREEFVNLHSQPLLERLRESLMIRYPFIEIPPVPQKGSLDLNEVKKSTYFFS